MAIIWAKAATYLPDLGSTDAIVQKKLQKYFHDDGKKILISAFGATDFPTSAGKDPIVTANDLADFVYGSFVDGVDIDW